MPRSISHAVLTACLIGISVPAQAPQTTIASQGQPGLMRLRYASFDPLASLPEVPAALRSTASQQLWIVQFTTTPTDAGRDAITGLGGKILGYLPDNAYVVRMQAGQAENVRRAPSVRWVGSYQPAYRLEPELLQAQAYRQPEAVRYNLVVADKHTDKPALIARVEAAGGRVDNEQVGSLLLEVTLTGPQLLAVAGMDEVLWIDRWTPSQTDMDNARIQGGGNYIEAQAGYSGTGVNAHIYEGIEASHPDFTGGAVNVRSNGAAQTHGHATGGIVFGNGSSNPAVRGMAPDAGKFYTTYTSVSGSRYQVVSDLVNIHDVSHTTASWGGSRTFFYTATSADADDIVFDHDIAWTQSQSNAGNQDSRPEAWAKNVFSIGGVNHGNNSNPGDDSWQAGNGSTGPASDGRIKPTLCAYYDNIGTSDLTSGGYSAASWYASFGGTSGATPIVAGHNVLAIEMFTDEVIPGFGPFGNQLRVPGGTSHQNRPHFPTLKALQIVSANQYAFTAASNDNRREHQGWGFPSLRNLWDNRAKTFLVDETDVLVQGQTRSWGIAVGSGEPALKVCLNWNEPAGNPAAAQQLINNLSLRVTSPGGTSIYWGNNNLQSGVWSTPGGSEDMVNSLECVFVQNPQPGNWQIEVIASAIVQDNHVETPAVDADYGLVVIGGQGSQVQFATFTQFGQGCQGSVQAPNPPCAQFNPVTGPLTQQLSPNEYCYRVGTSGTLLQSFDIYMASTGGTVTLPARIYVGTQPGGFPSATTTITVGPTPGFYTATFATPVAVGSTFFIGVDTSAQTAYLADMTVGSTNIAYSRPNAVSPWTLQLVKPAWRISCAPTFLTPALANDGLPQLGTSYDLTLSEALPSTFAVLVSGLSDTTWSGGALPALLPGAPGCELLVAPEVLDAAITTALGTAAATIAVPNTMGLIGLDLFHQWAVLDGPANALGIVLTNAGRAKIGN